MADSTAFIDTTSTFDATSYIYVDDSTSTITVAESASAQSTVNDFDATSGPVERQANEAQKGFDDIINDMSKLDPTDYTPKAVMDAYTQNALDQAYSTVGWQQGVDALKQVNNIGANCSLIDASSLPKYGDLAKQVSSMKKGVIDDVAKSIAKVGADIASKTGKVIAESAIGKKLSNMVNSGTSKIDTVKTSNSNPVSSILETGKGGMAKAQSVISKLGPTMNLMDTMINCVSATGGADYVSEADAMIDRTNGLFAKMYMFDDPAQPNYGEFNQGAFANSIPSVPKAVIDNVFTTANMFNKADNNAALSTKRLIKQAKPGAKSTSSLDPNGQQQSIDQKRTLAERLTQVKVTFPKVPAATDRPAQSAEIVSAPPPQQTTEPQQIAPQEQPPEEISYRNLIFETDFKEEGSYSALDPDLKGVPSILATATDIMPDGGTTDTDAKMKITVGAYNISITKTITPDGTQAYNKLKASPVYVQYERVDKPPSGGYPIATARFTINTKKVDVAAYKEPTADQLSKWAATFVSRALKELKGTDLLTDEKFDSTFG